MSMNLIARYIAASVVLAAAVPAGALASDRTDVMPRCDMTTVEAGQKLSAPPGEKPPVIASPPNSISITDAAITRKLFAAEPVAKRTPTGTMKVVARFFNCTNYPLQIDARTQFLDGDQQPAEPVSAWKRVFLPPRANTYYEESSIAVEAQSFQIDIREGK
jgi:hypothetical protein